MSTTHTLSISLARDIIPGMGSLSDTQRMYQLMQWVQHAVYTSADDNSTDDDRSNALQVVASVAALWASIIPIETDNPFLSSTGDIEEYIRHAARSWGRPPYDTPTARRFALYHLAGEVATALYAGQKTSTSYALIHLASYAYWRANTTLDEELN